MQNTSPQTQGQAGFNWFVLVLRSPAVILEVIAHRGMGARYFDFRAGIAAVLIWLAPLFFSSSSPVPVRCFLVLYLAMCIRARLEAFWLERRGYAAHSRYSGLPVICRWRPRWNELAVKRFLEPGLALVIGWAVASWWSPPLGMLFACCGVSAFLDVSEAIAVNKQRRMDVRDAVLDADNFRDIRR